MCYTTDSHLLGNLRVCILTECIIAGFPFTMVSAFMLHVTHR